MKVRTFASVAVMSALGFLIPINAHAFGLGKIELSSSLNQPFRAEINVTALKMDDEGKLLVQLATNAEFEKAGLERSFLLMQLKFEVVENGDAAKILISSSQPIKEPFIDFLLTATTGKGRLIREYTVLLDPPKNVFVKPQAAPQPQAVAVKKKKAPMKSTYQYPDPEMPVEVTQSYSSATSYGPVASTDTLWDIAKDTKPSSVISQDQMMMAILNANKKSFSHNNINGLKAGYTLDIPSADEIQALSRNQAYAAVVEQNNLWKNRNKAPVTVTEVIEEEITSLATADVDANEAVPTTPVEADEQNTARLQLVSPTDDELSGSDEQSALGDKELTQLSEQLTLAQETIESQAQENIDFKSRMDLMEEQLQTLRQLITLKDADLARMQSNLENNAADGSEQPSIESIDTDLAPETALVDAEQVATASLDDEPLQIETTSVKNVIETASESEMSEVDAYFAQIGNADTDLSTDTEEGADELLEPFEESVNTVEIGENDSTSLLPLEVAKNFVDTSVAKVKTFYSDHKQESLIAGFVAALLALLLLLFRARGRKEDANVSDVVSPASTVTVGETHTTNEAPDVSDATDEDIIKAAYASLEEVEVDSPDVEDEHSEKADETPVFDEPEVTDIEELEDVIIPAPELNVEPEQSENLDITFDLDEPEQSDTLDVTLDIEEPEAESVIEFNLDSPSVEDNDEVSSDEEESDSVQNDDLLDFNTDTDTDTDTDTLSLDNDDAELTLDDEPLSFDIDSQLDEVTLDDSPVELESIGDDQTDDSLSIDLDLDADLSTLSLGGDADDTAALPEVNLDALTSTLDVPNEELLAAASTDEGEVDFDLGNFDEIDEAETKLDLAGAYIDMGDPEGARSILEEVITDGSDEQKSKAQALLNDLS